MLEAHSAGREQEENGESTGSIDAFEEEDIECVSRIPFSLRAARPFSRRRGIVTYILIPIRISGAFSTHSEMALSRSSEPSPPPEIVEDKNRKSCL